jgi:hypothetical protein
MSIVVSETPAAAPNTLEWGKGEERKAQKIFKKVDIDGDGAGSSLHSRVSPDWLHGPYQLSSIGICYHTPC